MSDEPKLDSKQCMSCRRVMPTSHFGKFRGSQDGLLYDCKLCINLAKRRRYSAQYGYADPNKNPLPQSNPRLKDHNDQIVSLGLLRQTYQCLGHNVINHNQYRVEFSMVDFLARLQVYDGDEMVLDLRDGVSDVHQFKKSLLNNLYDRDIRLEKTDLDLHLALREIYFI
jgi:hypothetical protein